jgi:aryl-alcohol dehydrogenase-like predicted oxidoreductase
MVAAGKRCAYGKYHGHGSSEPGRLSSDMLKDFCPEQQRADRIVAAVKHVSDQVGRTMAEVALAWLRYRAVPIIPILGARKLSQLQDNLAIPKPPPFDRD